MSDSNFLRSGDLSVPNTSMVGGGFIPPNNSICVSGGFNPDSMRGSVSDEKLSDQLIQVALYQQLEAPPSTLGGDTTNAKGAFDDIDFASQGQIPFRYIVRLLKPEDAAQFGSLVDAQALLQFSDFVAFIEGVYAQRRPQQ